MIFLRIFRRLNRDLTCPWTIFEKFRLFSLNFSQYFTDTVFCCQISTKKINVHYGFLVDVSNFDSFYKNIWSHDQPVQNEFHRCLSQGRNDCIPD
jgi:hypothetical protein